MESGKLVKVLGFAVAAAGMGLSLLTDWVNEKKMEETIEEKVSEALAKQSEKES